MLKGNQVFMNDWNAFFEELPAEHRAIIQSTLPTQSFEMLLNLYSRHFREKLQHLDISRSDSEFKEHYILYSQKAELAESLVAFVNSIHAKLKPT